MLLMYKSGVTCSFPFVFENHHKVFTWNRNSKRACSGGREFVSMRE